VELEDGQRMYMRVCEREKDREIIREEERKGGRKK